MSLVTLSTGELDAQLAEAKDEGHLRGVRAGLVSTLSFVLEEMGYDSGEKLETEDGVTRTLAYAELTLKYEQVLRSIKMLADVADVEVANRDPRDILREIEKNVIELSELSGTRKGCTCLEIMSNDISRHFLECPLRAKYPKPRSGPLAEKP